MVKPVLITGASGLLGRALVNNFSSASGWHVTGLANSRAKNDLVKVNLLEKEELERVMMDIKPQVVIHAAAERNCNVVDANYEAARNLNVTASKDIAELAAKIRAVLIYISTDYVFDGTSPPYKETDEPNPLNKYGLTKLEGENVTLRTHPGACVLRVPLLYGEVDHLGESVVTGLLPSLLDRGNVYRVSDYEIRYPTYVGDVAEVCCRLATAALRQRGIGGIYHCSGRDAMTKYGMVKIISEKMQLAMDHIVPDREPVKGAPRPYDSHLDTSKLDALVGQPYTPFRDAIKNCLINYVPAA